MSDYKIEIDFEFMTVQYRYISKYEHFKFINWIFVYSSLGSFPIFMTSVIKPIWTLKIWNSLNTLTVLHMLSMLKIKRKILKMFSLLILIIPGIYSEQIDLLIATRMMKTV